MSTYAPAEILSGGNATAAYERISKLVGVAEAILLKDVETFETLRESAKEYVFGTGEVAGIVQVSAKVFVKCCNHFFVFLLFTIVFIYSGLDFLC